MNIRKMVPAALMAALMAVCSWLSIPVPPVVFTLQSFAFLLTLGVLGGKWGSVTVLLYLLLGLTGLPVFAGFRFGPAAFLDPTGGFLLGFLMGALVYWLLERLGKIPAMIAAQLTCYGCGCVWFSHWAGDAGFLAAALTCVVPYLIPDALKLWLAVKVASKLENVHGKL